MNELTLGLLGALLATNQPLAVSNVIQQHTGVAIEVAGDPAERELRDVMLADDAAQDEVGRWISTNTTPQTNVMATAEFNRRIRARFEVVRQGYEKFLRNHPGHARGYLAYGSFLTDIGDEDAAKAQYENSRQLDPKNPAVWNNLANYYGEYGELTNAFACYTEAIRLQPDEPVYYQNFATTVYLFRKDARDFYGLNEQQVFDKALGLYRQAMHLAPASLVLATDYAESYYGIKPLRTHDALAAWTNALNLARTDAERQGVELHLARVKIAAGLFDEAQTHLAAATNAIYADLRQRLERSLADRRHPAPGGIGEAPTGSAVALTNAVTDTANPVPVLTNSVSTLTNPPPLSTNVVAVMTNVPPVAPKPSVLQAAPPILRELNP